MEVVLFRHGKAEPYSDAKRDSERELTSVGQKKMKQAARGIVKCLFPGCDIQIWTSPLARAQQTAQIIKSEFGKRAALRIVDAVESGSLEELSSEWAALPEDTVLIIVGHEPMMSEWTKALSGASLAFRPGSAASIILDGENRRTGLLSWFMRVGVMARLCSPSVTKRRKSV